ncbi:unnamed protein product [Rhodiola kirilowii]
MTKDGFYVRMKLKNTSRNGTVWYLKRFKWLIWISLALYFLTSYLITKTTSLHITTVHGGESEIISRALIESVNTTSFSNQSIAFTSASGPRKVNDLKIYVYDLPPRYNLNWLANQRCSSHLFAAEVAIHKAILNSETRTFDPWGADFFFVPVYVSCNFSTVNGFPAIAHARPLIASAVELISSQLSFWNRSDGADHVFVASHDYGSCFHAMEDKAVENGVPEFLKKSIILQTFGVKYHHPCQEVTNVVIPPYVSPEKLQRTLARVPANGQRDIWAFFRGKMEVHPKNISGRFYSKRVRTVIWERLGRDRRFYLKRPPLQRIPVRDCAVNVLPVSAGVGSMESEAGRVRRFRLRPRHHRRRHSSSLRVSNPVVGHLSHRRGKRRRETRRNTRPRGGDESLIDTA